MTSKYIRQEQIAGWQQSKLEQATVIVIGIGALGNEVARLLALSGVGHLVLCDPDHVELSNLHRCGLFKEADVGSLKVEVAARSLLQLVPAVRVDCRPYALVHGVGLAELRDASLVVSCLDSRASRIQLAGRCNLVGVPLIDGGTNAWGGEVRPFLEPSTGACYGCGMADEARSESDMPWSCQDTVGTLPQSATAASSVLVASWMSLLAVRFLMGLPVQNQYIAISAEQGSVRKIKHQRDEDCLLHTVLSDDVIKTKLSYQSTIGELMQSLEQGAVPLAWSPVQTGMRCKSCGNETEEWKLPEMLACPECSGEVFLKTTLELSKAPDEIRLQQLGVSPREILAVRGPEGFIWLELDC